MDDHPLDRWLAKQLMSLASVAVAAGLTIVLVWFPDYWFLGLGALFVLFSGLLTTRVVLQWDNPWAICGLSPVFGCGWLVLLWLLFKLVGSP